MSDSVKLRRKFYRELPEYETLLGAQEGVCRICQRPPHKLRLSVDHDHAVDRVKVKVKKYNGSSLWHAQAYYKNDYYSWLAPTREEAWRAVKENLFRDAIRGLLCFLCNGGIQHFEDSKAPLKPAERFDAAAKYFRDFEKGQNV